MEEGGDREEWKRNGESQANRQRGEGATDLIVVAEQSSSRPGRKRLDLLNIDKDLHYYNDCS